MEQRTSVSGDKVINNINFNSPLVEVTRQFSAPLESVWQAWTDPGLTKQWWGPEGFTCPEAKIDFREGGKYLVAMKDPDGKVTWSGGVYEEIIPFKKIVNSDYFTDEQGNPISPKDVGMPGEWPEECRITVDFVKINESESRINLSAEGIPAEIHDDCVKGWSTSIDKLQRLVEKR